MTTLERIDQLLGYALKQRDTYIKNTLSPPGYAPQYHLGYIAALRAIRQHVTKPVEQTPLVILGQGDFKTIIKEDDIQ